MEITGKIIQKLPIIEGESKNGKWKKQDIIIETLEEYSRKVCVSVWNGKIEQSILEEGNTITVSINLESREYNGKWYTNIKALRIELAVEGNKLNIDDNTPKIEPSDDDLDWLNFDEAEDDPF